MYSMPDKDEAPWLDCMDGFELLGEANLDLINQNDVGDYKAFNTVEELMEDLKSD
jgi:hypothetical protein